MAKKKIDKKEVSQNSNKWLRMALITGPIVIIITFILFLCLLEKNPENKSETETSKEKKPISVDVGSTPFTEINLKDAVTLGDYTNVEVECDIPETITEDDYIAYVNKILENNPRYNEMDKTNVEEGDIICIYMKGIMDNEEDYIFDETDLYAEVGSDSLLSFIMDTFTGRKVGDSYDIKYEYTEDDADGQYAGRTITVSVTIKSINEKETINYTTLTDEYAKNVLGCYSADDFLSQVKSEMYSAMSDTESSMIANNSVSSFMDTCSFNVPESYYEEKLDEQKQIFINVCCDGDESKYASTIKDGFGLTEEEYEKTMEENIAGNVNMELVAKYIAEKEGIEATGDDYESFLSGEMSTVGVADKESLFAVYDNTYESGEEYLKTQYYIEKVTEMLQSSAVLKRTEGATVTEFVFGK